MGRYLLVKFNVCVDHIKTSGIKKKDLNIVSKENCDLCKMFNYFNNPFFNPCRKTVHEIVEMRKERSVDNSGKL